MKKNSLNSLIDIHNIYFFSLELVEPFSKKVTFSIFLSLAITSTQMRLQGQSSEVCYVT